ncbi:MAG: PEGA domain-containing protein [Myxococcota bacterium]
MMLRWWWVLALVLWPALGRAEPARLMVLPFTGDNVKEEVLSGLQAMFVDEARKIPDVEITEMTSRALVVAGDCAGDTACLGKGLGRLGATQFILTNVRRLSGGYLLSQSLHQCPGGDEVRASEETLKGRGSALEKLTYRAAVKLLAPERLVGAVQVDVNVAGATVHVDGKPIGKTPLPGAYAVGEGRHRIKVTKDGYETFQGEVEVTYEETAAVDVRLLRDQRTVSSSTGGGENGGGGLPPALMGGLGAVGIGAGVAAALFVVSLIPAGALTGGLALATYYQAREIENRAKAGQLLLPADERRLLAWRLLWGGTLASLGTPVLSAVGSVVVGVVVAVVGFVISRVTAPKEEVPDEELGFRRRTEKPRPEAEAEAEEEKPAAPEEQPQPKPRKRAPPKEAPLPEGDELPEGE